MEQFNVTGMSCAACVSRVEKAVGAVEGVSSCTVSLLTNSMAVDGTATAESIIAAVTAAGYGASVKGQTDSGKPSDDALEDKETPKLRRRLIASLGFLAVLMYISMGHTMWSWPLPRFFADNPVAIGLAQLILSATVMVINQKFFISGFKGLLHRSPNMDTLVALGSSAAFGYSTVMLFAMTASAHPEHYLHEFYFESAAMILALITVGKTLEARSKGKTTDALKSLMKLSPKTARLIVDGKEKQVGIEQVKAGDVFAVKPGESIPVDGRIIEGEGAVNEAALTGESIPIDKAVGDNVSAATVNQSGFIKCTATRVGEDTTLAQIIKMVESAAATKAPIAKVADKVSGIFVPTVICIAAVTIIAWLIAGEGFGFALARGISVLVISCPCALGLATPVAIMVGNGVAAKNGILFKNAISLEKAGKAEIILLDKTGTITQGEPSVTAIKPCGVSENELLLLAASAEAKSEHPLAKAITKKAEALGIAPIEVEAFSALPGNGLKATIKGETVYGGKAEFIGTKAMIPDEIRTEADRLSESGNTPLFFCRGNKLLGCIAVADVIKEDSPKAISELKKLGLRVVMLTGDNKKTAEAIGKKAGVDEVIAGVLPQGKADAVNRLKKQGCVAMVGDGINDAPALTTADIGIAIGAGADVAIDAAEIVLMKSRLTDVAAAIRLSRATLRNIHENLFWAFCYNCIGIPLAAGVFISLLGWQLNPMFGAAAMSLSSFCVVTNALRLNRFKLFDGSKDRKIKTKHKKEIKEMTKTIFITGMMCGHCEATVKKALEALDGVTSAAVSHDSGTAVVTLSAPIEDSVLKATVEEKDFTVTEIK